MFSKYAVDIDPEGETSHGLIVRLVGESKKVLDIGCAAGDLARVLVERGCEVSGVELDPVAGEAAQRTLTKLVLGDVTELDLVSEFDGQQFDVIVLGDVVEHVLDPGAVLRRAKEVLAPGGYIVLSVPNVSHASVRLALTKGEFRYTPLGILDETHVRFFTRRSLYELLASEGFVVEDAHRTVAGPFGTELGLKAQDFPDDLVNLVMADHDASTYQFVLVAIPASTDSVDRWLRDEMDRADHMAAAVQSRMAEHGHELSTLRVELITARQTLLQREHELQREREDGEIAQRRLADQLSTERQARTSQQAELDRVATELASARGSALHAEQRVQAMLQSTSWRLSAPIRAFAPLRAAARGIGSGRGRLLSRGDVRRVAQRFHKEGARSTVRAIQRTLRARDEEDEYGRWVEAHGTLSLGDRYAIRRHIAKLPKRPLISVTMPTYNTDDYALRAVLDSVLGQLYEAWELCIVDDASSSPSVWATLNEYADRDDRIKLRRRTANGGIAAATNDAIDLASGEYLALLDHDDILAPHALYMVAVEVVSHPEADLIYTDEDKLDGMGRRYEPYFKPDFNHELLLGQNMISHLGVYRAALVRQIGGMRGGFDGSQDHDLALRVVAATTRERIRHIPFVLYHWRQYPGSGTFSSSNLEKANRAGRIAVQEHLKQLGESAEVAPAPHAHNWNRVIWPMSNAAQPEVSVVIPTRDRLELLRRCVQGVLEYTDYEALRVVVVDNGSVEKSTLAYLEELKRSTRVNVIHAPGPFNYSALNNRAVRAIDSPLVLLLNNDIFVRQPGWLKEMVSLIERVGVGIVGAKLLYPDGRVQHGGVLLGVGGVARHAHLCYPGSSPGYFGRLALLQEMSAVTGACLLTRRDIFEEVGGLDEENLHVAFNDVDYCLRVREAGYKVLWTPHAELTHLESVSRGPDTSGKRLERFEREVTFMTTRWAETLRHDPVYNPNLSLTGKEFSVAFEPRVEPPWVSYLK